MCAYVCMHAGLWQGKKSTSSSWVGMLEVNTGLPPLVYEQFVIYFFCQLLHELYVVLSYLRTVWRFLQQMQSHNAFHLKCRRQNLQSFDAGLTSDKEFIVFIGRVFLVVSYHLCIALLVQDSYICQLRGLTGSCQFSSRVLLFRLVYFGSNKSPV